MEMSLLGGDFRRVPVTHAPETAAATTGFRRADGCQLNVRSVVYRMLDGLAAGLLPARCLLCGRPGQRTGFDLCGACADELPRNCGACPRCGLPGRADGNDWRDLGACAQCAGESLAFDRCFAPLLYEYPVTALIPALKYRGALSHARVFGLLLARHVGDLRVAGDVDRVVPMPLHPARLVERGFNQSHEIARFTAGGLGLELLPHALRRTRRTAAQVGLERPARRANVRAAFAADPVQVCGRRIALLDDVVTTASTVDAAARALRDAGAARVDVWCVARVAG
jgi:ComF family protein